MPRSGVTSFRRSRSSSCAGDSTSVCQSIPSDRGRNPLPGGWGRNRKYHDPSREAPPQTDEFVGLPWLIDEAELWSSLEHGRRSYDVQAAWTLTLDLTTARLEFPSRIRAVRFPSYTSP